MISPEMEIQESKFIFYFFTQKIILVYDLFVI